MEESKKRIKCRSCASVAVRLIIDREKEIQAFKPEEYWTITGSLLKGKKEFAAGYHSIGGKKVALHSEEDVKNVLAKLDGNEFSVQSVTKKERKRNPAPPFTTSSLQQEAARKLNFRAKKTMMVTQQLYEGIEIGKEGTVGLITYMRTDSTRISETAQNEANSWITSQFGEDYLPKTQRKDKQTTGAQDAHEAVRPTSVVRDPSVLKQYLSRDQYRLYKLIWERFVASQMAPAIMDTMAVDLKNGDVMFRANGSKVKFAGFMKVYIEGNDDNNEEKENLLPDLKEGDTVFSKDIEPSQHFTQPPPRYTEARLVKTLEELGIGRPSTYAPTLDTIQKRGYVALDNKRFIPTELGEIIIEAMNEFFPDILDVEFTAKMENDLDSVEDGKVEWVNVIDHFYQDFSKDLAKAEEEMKEVEIKDEPTGETCEECGSPMVFKMGRYGKFAACSNFPDCRNTKPIIKDIGVKCPKCHEGNIVERKSKKRRIFYGCDQYPSCDFVSWDKPLQRPCPKCEGPLVEKKLKKGVQVQCIECNYKEEQQS